MHYLSRLLHEEDGQDMVEYALLAAFISIVAIGALRAIGPLVNAIYIRIRDALAPSFLFSSDLMWACACSTSAGTGVSPVPIAQTGS